MLANSYWATQLVSIVIIHVQIFCGDGETTKINICSDICFRIMITDTIIYVCNYATAVDVIMLFCLACGEPSMCMSCCALFAMKNAIYAAREEIGNKDLFSL